VKTLRDITLHSKNNGERQFQRVLIETTGLADPAPIIHTLMTHPQIARRYRLDGIVTTVDLATGMHTLDQHNEAIKQAAMADSLLLTKGDLVTDEQRTALLKRLDDINPAASRWVVHNGKITASKVLNLGLFTGDGKAPEVKRWLNEEAYAVSAQLGHTHDHHDYNHEHHNHHHDVNRHDDHIRAFCFTIEQPIHEQTLSDWLELLMSFEGNRILRVKGILNVVSYPQPVVMHGVQHIFHPLVTLPTWPSMDRRSRLVFITNDVSADVIEKIFNAFHQLQPKAEGLLP
jgi:G3E family GTPase